MNEGDVFMFLMAVNFCSETKDVWSLVGKILGVFKIVIPVYAYFADKNSIALSKIASLPVM